VTATTLASDGKTPTTPTKPPADDTQPKCSLPTGKTPADPIPFQWFKPRHDFYPRSVSIGGNVYERDDPGPHRLPVVDEPFGVAAEQWAHKGKLVQLKHWYRPFPSASDKYRTWINLANGGASLSRAGFQVDHVQDPQWGLPNGDLGGEELDAWWNLWPLGSQWNMGIAGYQNNLQTVSFCEGPNGPQRLKVPISQLKAEGRYGLFFVITEVSPIWRG
jgi:hypothetical protein